MKTLTWGALLIYCVAFTACNEPSMKEKLIGEWIEPIPGMESMNQGFKLEENGQASSVNMNTLVYEKWEQKDSLFILKGKSIGNGVTGEFVDTLTIKALTADSLILQKCDYTFKFKKNTEK